MCIISGRSITPQHITYIYIYICVCIISRRSITPQHIKYNWKPFGGVQFLYTGSKLPSPGTKTFIYVCIYIYIVKEESHYTAMYKSQQTHRVCTVYIHIYMSTKYRVCTVYIYRGQQKSCACTVYVSETSCLRQQRTD